MIEQVWRGVRAVDVGIFVKTLFGALNWVSVWYRQGGRLTGEGSPTIAETFLRALGHER